MNMRELGKRITYKAAAKLKDVDRVSSRVHFVISTDGRDRHGDVLVQEFDLSNFGKNPVFLNSHNYGDAAEVIGRVENVVRTKSEGGGEQHEAEVVFAVDENPKARVIFDLYANGFLHAVSIGGIPKGFDAKGTTVTSLELLEVSAVSVPANADAVASMKAKGIDVDALAMTDKASLDVGDDVTVSCRDCNKEIGTNDEQIYKRAVGDAPEDGYIGDEAQTKADLVCKACLDAAAAGGRVLLAKDVSEVVVLADVIATLHWLIRAFSQNEVRADVTDKMVKALELLLDALKDEATMGQKALDLAEVRKEGRVLSDKNRKLIGSTAQSLEASLVALRELLDATAPKDKEIAPKSAHERRIELLKHAVTVTEHLKALGEKSKVEHAGRKVDVGAEARRLTAKAVRNLVKSK